MSLSVVNSSTYEVGGFGFLYVGGFMVMVLVHGMELIQAQLVLRRIVIVVVEVDSYVSVIFIGQITVQIA